MKCLRCGKKLTADKHYKKFGATFGPECIKKIDAGDLKDSFLKTTYGKITDLRNYPELKEKRDAVLAHMVDYFGAEDEYYSFTSRLFRLNSKFWADNFETNNLKIALEFTREQFPIHWEDFWNN